MSNVAKLLTGNTLLAFLMLLVLLAQSHTTVGAVTIEMPLPVTESHSPQPVLEERTERIEPELTENPFTERQTELLRIAYSEGEAVGWPETIQAILLQETSAGVHGPVGDRSLGFGERSYCHMQVKLAAAADVIKHFDDIPSFTTEEELLVALLTDDEFCIRVGARYFKLMLDRTNTWSEAVVAYNRGVAGSRLYGDVRGYLPKIRARIHEEIRPHAHYLSSDDLQVAMN